jgi:hypothetical protein
MLKLKKLFPLYLALIISMFSIMALELELLDTNPAPIVSGEYNDITIRLFQPDFTSNIDSEQENIRFRIGESEFFQQISPSGFITISKISENERFSRTFRVFVSDDLPEGFVKIPLELYIGNQKFDYEVETYVKNSLENPILNIGLIESLPKHLVQDSNNNKLSITLQNLGEKEAKQISAKLNLKSEYLEEAYPFSLMDSLSSISESNEGILEFEFDILENAPFINQAELILKYSREDNFGNYLVEDKIIPFNITLSDSPYLIIEGVEQLSSFNKGTPENEILVKVKNIGSEDAENVRIRLKPDISYPFIFEQTTYYITANIAVGETASAIFKTEVLNSAQTRNFEIFVELESMIEDLRFTQEDTVSINITDENPTNVNLNTIIIIAIVLVLAFLVGLYTYRNNKKNK